MAENKGKKHIIAIIIPLLFLFAAAFFAVTNAGQKRSGYRPDAKESGYIDAQAVYNSNKNYGIMKREIEEYTARINKELARQLAREHNEAKRAQLKRLAKKEIEMYAETLLQDIDKDVDDAINEVAENKNLKRVYISGSVRQNGKNMTQAVITELNMTVMQRIGGYFDELIQEEKKQQPRYERQFNFDSYPVAKVPEQGVTKEASGSLAIKKKKGSIVADTQLQPKDKEERFVWKQTELKTAAKKTPVAKQSAKHNKTQNIYANAGKIKLPSGKAESIVNGSKYALSNSIAYIQARNAALTELSMSAQKPTAKNSVAAKTATKQPKVENKVAINETNAIASRPTQITAAQIAELLNATAAKLQEYTCVVIQNTQDTMAMVSVKCGKMWEKIYPFAATTEMQLAQTYGSVTEATTENVAVGQQPATQETAKGEKAVEMAVLVEQTADKPTDIKQTKQPEQPKTEKVGQQVTDKQTEEPKVEKAEQKSEEKQSETKTVKTAENPAEKAVSNIDSKPVTIQVAACINKSGADAAAKKLRGKHIPARVDGIVRGGTQWWCVRITANGSAQANGYKQQLSAMGYSGIIVR